MKRGITRLLFAVAIAAASVYSARPLQAMDEEPGPKCDCMTWDGKPGLGATAQTPWGSTWYCSLKDCWVPLDNN